MAATQKKRKPRNRENKNTVRPGWSIKDACLSAESAWKARTAGRSPKCEVCGYNQTTKHSNFKAHVHTHVVKSLLQIWCPFCPETFSVKGTLTRHIMRHHAGNIVGDNSDQGCTVLPHDVAECTEVEYSCDSGSGILILLQNILSGARNGIAKYIERTEISVEELSLIFGIVD